MRRLIVIVGALWLGFSPPARAAETETASPAAGNRFRLRAGWPEGITYEVGRVSPSLAEKGPLSNFEEIFVKGRVGARLDVDAAAFVADASLSDCRDDVQVRRARFYLLGDVRLGLALAYKFEFSIEGSEVFLNDFYLRWKPSRWVDAVDIGYLTPPMGLENVVSSRSLSLMEISAPVQALAPGYRSGSYASSKSLGVVAHGVAGRGLLRWASPADQRRRIRHDSANRWPGHLGALA